MWQNWSMCLFFRDAASRREPLSVIGQLAETQPEILVTSLLHCLLNCGLISKSGVPRYTSQLYILFLKDSLKGFQQYYCKMCSHCDCALSFVCYI